jgi:2-methylisocitrate lyase-like PEP mutase family enzyme
LFNSPQSLRELLARPEPIVRPAVGDALTARIAQEAGFECVAVGGYALGARSCIAEPLHDMTFVTEEARQIQNVLNIPVTVDCGAGFGEAIQVWQTVQALQKGGLAAIQIEDQVFPKRAHYHRDYQEHTISMDHMVEKVTAAVEARTNPDFVVIARTDSMKTDGYDEAVRRGNAYAKAGADVVMVFPSTLEETKRLPRDVDAPCAYVVSHGNRVGRPVPTARELADMGYKLISYSSLSSLVIYRSLLEVFSQLKRTGDANQTAENMIAARKALEDLIGLPHLYEIEERTTESRQYIRTA